MLRRFGYLEWLNLAFALLCLAILGQKLATIGLHVPLDPNEGWNAYHAAAAMSGGPLYPQGLFFNNYPPLSFYVVGLFGLVTGDYIVAGRIVALFALAATAVGIFFCARQMEAKPSAALFAALWFVASMLAFTGYVAMDDPQLLGHAFATGGLFLLLRRNVVGAALAMTLALFVKHNLIALPIAALVWLAIYNRREAWKFAASGIGFGLIGLLVSPPGLLAHLDSPRTYSFSSLKDAIDRWLPWGGPGIAIIAAAMPRWDKHAALVACYALASCVLGVFFSGGAGVDVNAWFDAAIAVSLGAALALIRFDGIVLAAYGLSLFLGSMLVDHDVPPAATADIVFLKAHDGPALCEMPSLCYWAGKKAEVDVFNLGQAYATGARKDGELIKLIDARRYRAVQFDSLDEFAFGPRVKQALLRGYRVDHEDDDGVFLVPR